MNLILRNHSLLGQNSFILIYIIIKCIIKSIVYLSFWYQYWYQRYDTDTVGYFRYSIQPYLMVVEVELHQETILTFQNILRQNSCTVG